jgi:hypothetical protein
MSEEVPYFVARPKPEQIDTSLQGYSPEKIEDIAQSYFDLMKKMLDSMQHSELSAAVVTWNGQGFAIEPMKKPKRFGRKS